MRLSRFFIDRPIFAAVLSIVIFIAGPDRDADAADQRVPGGRAAVGRGARDLPRRQPPDAVRGRGDAARGADQRRREHAVHVVAGHVGRRAHADRDLPGRHRRGPGAGAGAEPGEPGAAPPAGRSAPARRHHRQELAQLHHGGAPGLAGQPVRRRLPAQLRPAAGQGRAGPDSRRRAGPGVRRRRLRHAGLARSRQGGAPAASPPSDVVSTPSASRTCRSRPAWWARRRCRCRWTTSSP